MTFFARFIGIVILLGIGYVFSGYALSVLWGWFIVPVFELPELSVVPAIGIIIVVGYLTKQYDINEKDKNESLGTRFSKDFVKFIFMPAYSLFLGYIVHFLCSFILHQL